MTFAEKWRAFNEHPSISGMSYADQASARSIFLQETLPTMPEFAGLDSAVQQEVFRNYLRTPPTFSEEPSTEAQRYIELAEGLRNGDEGAAFAAATQLGYQSFSESNGIFAKITEFAARFVDDPDTKAAMDAVTDRDSEDYKAVEYLRAVATSDDAAGAWSKAAMIGGTIGGVGTSIAAGRVALTAPLNWARSASTAYAAALGSGGRSPFTSWLFGSAIPNYAESVVDGAALMAGHLFNENPEGDLPESLRPGSRAGQIALAFGGEVLQDMLFWTGLNLAGAFGKNVARVFSKGGLRNRELQQVMQDEAFGDLVRRIATGEDISKAQAQSLDPDVVRTFRREYSNWAMADRFDELSPDEANQFIAKAKANLDLVQTDSGWRFRNAVTGDFESGVYSSSDSAMAELIERRLRPPERTYAAVDSALKDEFEIQRVVTTTTDSPVTRSLSDEDIARAFTPNKAGSLHAANVELAARSFVDVDTARKLDIVSVSDEAYAQLDDVSRVSRYGDRINLYVPNRVKSIDGLERTIRNIGDDLAPFAKNPSELPKTIRRITDLQKLAPSSVNPDVVISMAKSLGLEADKVATGIRIGGRTYTDLGQALKDIGKAYASKDADTATKLFSEQFGIKISRTKGPIGQFVAKKDGNILEYGKSPEELAQKLTDKGFTPRLDMEVGPRYLVDESAGTISFEAGIVRGPAKYVSDYAGQYFKRSNSERILQSLAAGTISRDSVTTAFQVKSPEWGLIASFDSYKKATNFIKKNTESLEGLRDFARIKGIPDIRTSGGSYLARDIEGNVHTFDSFRKLRDFVKNTETPETWTREISNLNTEEVDQIWDQIEADELRKLRADGLGQPVDWSPVRAEVKDTWLNEGEYRRIVESFGETSLQAKSYSVRLNFQKLRTRAGRLMTSPMYNTARKYVAETDVEGFVTQIFEPMEKQIKNARGMLAQFTDLIDGVAAVGKTNKRIGIDVRRKALQFLQADPADWGKIARDTGVPLDGELRTYIERYRKALDTLGTVFDIDGYKLLTNYLPHIQEYMLKHGDVVVSNSFAENVVNAAFGGKAPKEVRFFAEYMRTNELSDFIAQTDPQELLARYVTKGVKNLTLGRTYNRLTKHFEELVSGGQISPYLHGDMLHYLEDVMGMFSDASSKAAMATSQSMKDTFVSLMNRFSKEAKLTPKAANDMISVLHGLTIASTMSFRPWLPIRNMQQIWTTLAGHFGNAKIMRALNKMADADFTAKRATKLRNSGRLRENAPIFGLTKTTFFDRFNRVGMQAYTNSDQYTRLVVDLVVEDSLKPAALKYARGLINEKQFLRLSELSRFDSVDQRHIVDLLNTKGYEAAQDYFADIVDRETMFAYTAGSNPAAWRGFFGRLFGVFGHYPVYYARNILNGLRRGSPFQRLQFAGRVAFNTAALWYIFEKTFGIKADAFVPWKTMFFDGGPYYKLLNDTLGVISGDPMAPSIAQLRKQVTRTFLPLGLAFRRTLEGLDLISQGQTYRGFVAMMSAPLADEE